MKPIAKVALIGTITLLVGAAVFGTAATLSYTNNIGSGYKNREEAVHYTSEGEVITGIDFSFITESVVIKTGDVSNVTIDYKDFKEESAFDVSVTSGVLTMKEKATKGFNWFGFVWFWEYKEVADEYLATVTIPSSLDLSYNIVSTSGSIVTGGITSTKSYSAVSTSGAVTLNNATVDGNVTLSSVSGAVEAENVNVGGCLNLSSTSGSCLIKNAEVTKDIVISSTSGAVNVTNGKCESIDAKDVSGSINLSGIDVTENVIANNTSGSISISLVGDDAYQVTHSTTSGAANIKIKTDPSATKAITAKTVSGSISISYAA